MGADGPRPWWASPPGAHGSRTTGPDDAGDTDGRGASDEEATRGGSAGDGESSSSGASGATSAGPAAPHGPGETCQICPFCAFVRVVSEVRPEVVEHLVEASRHLSLAAKAVVDAHADGFGNRGRLEHIALDED